ncbi:excalibur calcium-binding domain-containing protein [Streptomyces sp. NPDC020403]|uniref:excalibur calcium-binding domain-containing protein n=1 Tax=unclassified Streptomyces TaxID=2593676 RepID=UPI0034022B2B
MSGPFRMSAGAVVLAVALAGCGGESGQDTKASPRPASPSAPRALALALADDEESTEAGRKITVDALTNDAVTMEGGTDAPLLDTYEPVEFTLTVASPTPHGTVTVEGSSLVYTPANGYAGEDTFTYDVALKEKGKGKSVTDGHATVRITVTRPTPTPTPTPTPKPKPKPTPTVARTAKPKAEAPVEPSVYYANCDAARAAGAAPVRRGDPGYAAHLDRDNDGVGCEPYGSSGSGGSSSGGSSGGGSTGGGNSAYYANCTAVRAAGAAPIHRGDPGYGSHLDRDGDGVACE